MAISLTVTLSSLDDYARLMGLDMNGWNQTKLPATPTGAECPHIWFQEPDLRTAETVGRDDVANALDIAEDMIAHALGFKVLRTWEAAEEHQWLYPRNAVQIESPIFETDWGQVYQPGIKASSIVVASQNCIYSDEDGDGVLDTVTITVTAAQMLAVNATVRELAVYFEGETDDAWEIRPLKIVENSTTGDIAITGPACRFLDPDLWFAASPSAIDLDPAPAPPASGNFVLAADVRRVYNDQTIQGEIVWKGGDTCSLVSCAEVCQDACVTVVNPRLGHVRLTPASVDTSSLYSPIWTSNQCLLYANPTAVRVNYYAGLRKEYANRYRGDGRMPGPLAEAIVRLANTLLPAAPCSCGIIKQRWARDRAEKEKIDSVDAALANAAFGSYMAGAIWAWGVIKRLNPIAGGASL